MTSQNNLNKDFVKMFETLSQSINDLRKAVTFIAEDVKDLKFDKMDISLKMSEIIILMTV
jgi:hypothetical protein